MTNEYSVTVKLYSYAKKRDYRYAYSFLILVIDITNIRKFDKLQICGIA